MASPIRAAAFVVGILAAIGAHASDCLAPHVRAAQVDPAPAFAVTADERRTLIYYASQNLLDAAGMRRIAERVPPLDRDITLYRGDRSVAVDPAGLEVGAEVSLSLRSSSYSEETAAMFARSRGGGYNTGVISVIHLRKGDPAGIDFAKLIGRTAESEVLVDHRLRFRVIRAWKSGGFTYRELEPIRETSR